MKNCFACKKFTNQRCEHLIPTTLLELPRQQVGTDLFELKGCSYLLLLLSCPPFTETLDVWPRLGTLQSSVICSHQIFLVAMLPKIWTLEEVPQSQFTFSSSV